MSEKWFKSRLSTRIRVTVALILFGGVVLASFSWLALNHFKQQLRADAYNHLLSMASIQQQRVSDYLGSINASTRSVASRTQLRLSLRNYNQQLEPRHLEKIGRIIQDALLALPQAQQISIADPAGKIIAATREEQVGVRIEAATPLSLQRDSEHGLQVHVYSPLYLEQDQVGMLHMRYTAAGLVKIISSYSGLGRTGETLLARRLESGAAQFLVPLRFDPQAALQRTIPAQRNDAPIIRALRGDSGFHEDVVDYRGAPVVAVTTLIPETGWGLLVKGDQSELYFGYRKLMFELLELLAVIVLVAFGVALFMAGYITRPVAHLKAFTERVRAGKGREQNFEELDLDEESYQLAKSLSEMTDEILQVFEAAPSGMVVVDSDGVIVRCNRALQRMFGYREGELVGVPIEVLVPETQRSQHQQYRQRKVVERTMQMGRGLELYGRRKDGELVPVEIGLSELEMEGVKRVLATVVDISDRIQLIQEQEIQEEKDNFFATMSHELRTPLTSIIGNSEYLLDELNGESQEIVRTIKSAGEAQLALVNDILDMSKLQSGKFAISEQPYDLQKLVSGVENMMSQRAQDAGLVLQFKIEHPQPFQLLGDEQRIRQILLNLVGNAVKFTPQGKISVTVQVIFNTLLFTVEDTGIGMSPKMMERLFSRFEQADGSISRRFGGSGLGLFISLNLAELMGGTIDASSQEGVGSVFELRLPYTPSEVPLAPVVEKSAGSTDRGGRTLSGHVLVAEDTPMIQMLERRMLEKMGLQVSVAKNGIEAVEMAAADSFDVVLMDMQMPEMDGIEATRKIRESGNQVPVAAVTANVMQKHRDQFEQAGCNAFVSKPIDSSELYTVLKQLLAQ